MKHLSSSLVFNNINRTFPSSVFSSLLLIQHLSTDPSSNDTNDSQRVKVETAEFSGRSGEASDMLRTQLLDTALGHVRVHGWSHAALLAAASDLKLSPAVTGLLQR